MCTLEDQLEDGVSRFSEGPTAAVSAQAKAASADLKLPHADSRGWNSFLKGVLRKSWALDLTGRLTARDRVETLLYHGLCPGSNRDPRFPKLMPVKEFEEHVRTCARYSRPLPLKQALQPGVSGVVITFDDGYANNFDLVFPVLEKYRCPATIFLTTGFLDRSTPLWSDWLESVIMNAPPKNTLFQWRDLSLTLQLANHSQRTQIICEMRRELRALTIAEIQEFLRALETHLCVRYDWDTLPELLRPLTWDQVRTMRASGLISFGAHTVSHPVLSRCSEEIQTLEILESKRRIEQELGEECAFFAYPYGKGDDYTEITKRIVTDAGFKFALTAESGSTKPSSCNLYEVPRWGADITLNELSFLVAGGPAITGYLRGNEQH